MSTITISTKGWVVIPAELRRKYRLKAGDEVRMVDYGGVLAIVPALADPIRDAAGMLRSEKSLTRALIAEHRAEYDANK
jgi:AbrB family looped-hinge helix DNA binding protein